MIKLLIIQSFINKAIDILSDNINNNFTIGLVVGRKFSKITKIFIHKTTYYNCIITDIGDGYVDFTHMIRGETYQASLADNGRIEYFK